MFFFCGVLVIFIKLFDEPDYGKVSVDLLAPGAGPDIIGLRYLVIARIIACFFEGERLSFRVGYLSAFGR